VSWRGLACSADQVIVTNGSQQALGLFANAVLEPGACVAVEEPHYPGARQAFEAARAAIVPVHVDRQGLDVASLRASRRRPRLVFVTPAHQFPTGAGHELEHEPTDHGVERRPSTTQHFIDLAQISLEECDVSQARRNGAPTSGLDRDLRPFDTDHGAGGADDPGRKHRDVPCSRPPSRPRIPSASPPPGTTGR